ncbi:hypothetical protein DENSPDRAFT_884155 [Dentipellis sp. KUC8613]|nr:hypothetical protein DENSPDRAFT_884155 [Dentipellis sp. KUC8613]
MASLTTTTPERAADLHANLAAIRARVQKHTPPTAPRPPTLVAVSKYKPASDVQACYEAGQRDFGENYVQELVDKAALLPADIRWHFIGTLQSNKAKLLASIPNLYAVQTVTSVKAATALDKALGPTRTAPLNILLQVNTSGEEAKSGLPPLTSADAAGAADSALAQLALHVVRACPKLRLQGLMTIGALAASLEATDKGNEDFERLVRTRAVLEGVLRAQGAEGWGEEGRLLISMGMSSDFEAALAAGSDIVRVGTGVFGERHLKGEVPAS